MSYAYAYDPEVAVAIPSAPQLDFADIEVARALVYELLEALPPWSPDDRVELHVREIPRVAGSPGVDLYLIRPVKRATRSAAVLWFHGGGFVLGDAREPLPFLEQVVLKTGAVVASVQYRLAPETPYPGAVDDGYAALTWLRQHADEIGIDEDWVGVGGHSAGGALAAGLALRVRDEGGRLLFQALDVPVIDDRGVTDSATAYTDTLVWNRPNATASWRAYLRGLEGPVPAYAAPARAEDLGGLPPTFVSVAQFDPLRDEAIEYARRLAHANVPVELHLYAGTFHESASVAASAAVSHRHQADLLAAIVRAIENAIAVNEVGD